MVGEAVARWTGEPTPSFDILRSVRLGTSGLAVELVANRVRGIPARLAAEEAIIERAPVSLYDRRILRLVFLVPDIQREIFAGRQPPALNLERLMQMYLPLAWSKQREVLGWPTAA